MEMAVRSIEMAETVMVTDEDGSGGTSPSWQGAGTDTSVPQNSSTAAAELRNCFWKIADSFRVFRPEALYRQRGGVRSGPRPPHTMPARSKGRPHEHRVRAGCGPSPSPLRISGIFREK
jgi:hypothetical protein